MKSEGNFWKYSRLALVFIVVNIVCAVIIQYFVDPDGLPSTLITAGSALATVIMVIFIAKQLELTQETLNEMTKERVDLEALKCAIRGYLKRGAVDEFGGQFILSTGDREM